VQKVLSNLQFQQPQNTPNSRHFCSPRRSNKSGFGPPATFRRIFTFMFQSRKKATISVLKTANVAISPQNIPMRNSSKTPQPDRLQGILIA